MRKKFKPGDFVYHTMSNRYGVVLEIKEDFVITNLKKSEIYEANHDRYKASPSYLKIISPEVLLQGYIQRRIDTNSYEELMEVAATLMQERSSPDAQT